MNNINRVTTLASLAAIPVPEITRIYKPISHVDMDNLTRELIDKNNFSLKNII